MVTGPEPVIARPPEPSQVDIAGDVGGAGTRDGNSAVARLVMVPLMVVLFVGIAQGDVGSPPPESAAMVMGTASN